MFLLVVVQFITLLVDRVEEDLLVLVTVVPVVVVLAIRVDQE